MRLFSAALSLVMASTTTRAWAQSPTNPTAPTAAATTAAASTSQEVRARTAIKDAEKEMLEWQRCRQISNSFKADYDAKRAQLQAEYGKVPEALAEVLLVKNKRVTRLHALCEAKSKAVSDKLQQAGSILDGAEPKSLGWIQPRVKDLTALMKRFSQLSSVQRPAQDE